MNKKPFARYLDEYAPHPQEHIHRTEQVEVQVEDDRTGMSLETLKRALADNLYYILAKDKDWATPHDYFMALAYTVRDRLLHRWLKTVSVILGRFLALSILSKSNSEVIPKLTPMSKVAIEFAGFQKE